MLRFAGQRAPGLVRVIAMFAVAAIGLGPLLTSLHEATTPHARCAIHPAEIVHVQAAPAPALGQTPAVAAVPPHHADDEHERCAFDASRHLLASRPRASASLAPSPRVGAIAPATCLSFTSRLFRLAPKGSPPA